MDTNETVSTQLDIKRTVVRVLVTAAEAFLAVLVAAGTTNLNIEVAEAGLVAALAAGISTLYNVVRELSGAAEGDTLTR